MIGARHTAPGIKSTVKLDTGRLLLIVLLVAIILRLAAAAYLGSTVEPLPGTYDQISYHNLALRVLGGYGFTFDREWWPITGAGEPTAHWSYLYTLYLAGVYALAGPNPLVARILQAAIVGVLQSYFAYLLGRRLFNQKAGLAAAALTAVYVYFVYYAGALMTESFYFTSILASLYFAICLADVLKSDTDKQRIIYYSILLGLSLTITVLLRQLFLLFIPFLFLWILLATRSDTKAPAGPALSFFKRILVLAIPMTIVVLAILPFTIQNYARFERFVLLNTNAGYAFFWANHPIHGTSFIEILPEGGPSYQELIPAELRHLDEAALDQALLKRGLGFIAQDPERYVLLSLSRIRSYFKFWPSPDSGLVSNLSRVLSFGLMLPLMLYGSYLAIRRKFSWSVALLLLFMLVYTCIHLLSWALVRYRLPVDAVWLVFAGLAISDLWDRFSSE